jgi:hypothetical protein
MDGIGWISDFGKRSLGFVDSMQVGNYSYFKYSASGDYFGQGDRWGLGQIVFAVKILYMHDALVGLAEVQKENLGRAIVSFSDEDGYISDPLIARRARFRQFFSGLKKGELSFFSNDPTRRAETRQSLAALMCLGKPPRAPFLHVPYSKQGARDYLAGLDWSKPWGAGSHLSHLLFFYRANRDLFNYKVEETEELIAETLRWVDSIQSKRDGAWYLGSPGLSDRINGAMKVLTGLDALGVTEIKNVERLIDTALEGSNDAHACNNFNIVFVLYMCSRISNYRSSDILNFLENRLTLYGKFYHTGTGGFSFYRGKANAIYYGAKITRGKNEPDLHGTVLFTWGISLISRMMNLGIFLKPPIN